MLKDEIEKVKTYTQEAYTKLEEKKATMPEQKNLKNLSETISNMKVEQNFEVIPNGTIESSSGTEPNIQNFITKIKNFPYPKLNSNGDIPPIFSKMYALKEVDISNWAEHNPIASLYDIFNGDYNLKTANVSGLDFEKQKVDNVLPFNSINTLIGPIYNYGKRLSDANLYPYATTRENNYTFYFGLGENADIDSIMVVINGAYDLTTIPKCKKQKLYIGATNIKKLSDEQKLIATNKNWTLE